MLVAMAEPSEPERRRVDGGVGSRGGGDEGGEGGGDEGGGWQRGRLQGDSAVAALGRAKA